MEEKTEERNIKVVKTYGFKRKKSEAHPRLLPVIPNGVADEIPKSEFADISVISDGAGYEQDNSESDGPENDHMYFEPLKPDKKSQISLSQSSASLSESSTDVSLSPQKSFTHKRKRTGIPLQTIHSSSKSKN
jgi:hypothetical protein